MQFQIDHDLHIHSWLSSCSSDSAQTPEAILAYAKRNGFHSLCLTDHFWDKKCPFANDWYVPQNLEHIKEALPLPTDPDVKFYFGCETDINTNLDLGIARETCDEFDFIIVPTTHMHMFPETKISFEERARLFVERFDVLLRADLPFHKVGLAHITCPLLAGMGVPHSDHLDVLDLVSDADFHRLFQKTAKLGMGVELNMPTSWYTTERDIDRVFHPYRIAKAEGCKFYLGSDAHHPSDFERSMTRFRTMVDILDLTEEDKFVF